MGKRATKRQKTIPDIQPLGGTADTAAALADDAAKDDEERQLESLLFGTPYVPSGKGKGKQREFALEVSDDGDDAAGTLDASAGRELENMLDSDLFFVDDSAPAGTAASALDLDIGISPASEHASQSSASGSDSERDDNPPKISAGPGSTRRKPAWTDPDDPALQVSLAADPRLRKLRDAPGEDAVGGREYERRLRRQFERINPTPAWSTKARHPGATKRVRDVSSDATSDEEDVSAQVEDGEGDDVDGLLNTTGGLLGARKPGVLIKGTLAIERLRDANLSARAEGAVRCVRFHPSPSIPILCVASADRRVRLFNIDGHTNPLLHTLHLPELPVSTAHFHPRGGSLLLAGPRPFFHTYDLSTGAALRSPRGLWGSASGAAEHGLSLETAAFSPDGGVLAVAGRGGHVHLIDYAAGGVGAQVVGSVKMHRPARALWWAPGGKLMTLAEDAEVYVWDVGARRCVRRWRDDGAFGARVMEGDPAGRYLAIGSTTGYANVYGPDAANGASGTLDTNVDQNTRVPRPLKAISNLTTPVSTLRFNADAQLLAIASDAKKDQLRLIHLSSLTAFANWPTAGTPLGRVSSVDFSAGSEYVAIGNARGRVLLYGLKDYAVQ